MMKNQQFIEICREFATSPISTESYVKFRQEMLELIQIDPDRAIAYFLLGNFAKRCMVQSAEKLQTSSSNNEAIKRQLLTYLQILEEVFRQENNLALLAGLNTIVLDYESSHKLF